MDDPTQEPRLSWIATSTGSSIYLKLSDIEDLAASMSDKTAAELVDHLRQMAEAQLLAYQKAKAAAARRKIDP